MKNHLITAISCILVLLAGSKAAGVDNIWDDYAKFKKEYLLLSALTQTKVDKESISKLESLIAALESSSAKLKSIHASVPNPVVLGQELGKLKGKSHRLLAECYYKNSNLSAVQLHFKKGMDLQALYGDYEASELENDYQYLATVCEANKCFYEAASAYDTLLRLKEQRLGTRESRELLPVLRNLSRVMRQINEHNAADRLEERANQIAKQN